MRRNKPLRRKTPLRAKKPFWACSKNPRKTFHRGERSPTVKQPAKLRQISKTREKKLRTEYNPVRIAFIKSHPWCGICLVLGIAPPEPTTEVHHKFGRAGRLLCDPRGFISSCRGHREFPHENPRLARELGVLAEPQDWNRHAALDEIFGK